MKFQFLKLSPSYFCTMRVCEMLLLTHRQEEGVAYLSEESISDALILWRSFTTFFLIKSATFFCVTPAFACSPLSISWYCHLGAGSLAHTISVHAESVTKVSAEPCQKLPLLICAIAQTR